MNTENVDKKYIITYSNSLEFAGRKLSFRKKHLFDLTSGVPKLVLKSKNGWWVNRQLLTEYKAKELCRLDKVEVDVSDLQWYVQCQLDEVFNLK